LLVQVEIGDAGSVPGESVSPGSSKDAGGARLSADLNHYPVTPHWFNPHRVLNHSVICRGPTLRQNYSRHGKTNQEFWRQLPLLAVSPEV
jgi:hypothetical protein